MSLKIDTPEFNFTIVGGGAAGWLTALFVKQFYPVTNVTVIESPEIGILGAGEGTLPPVTEFFNELGIFTSDIIAYANGTIKNGIKFTNWDENNGYFYHGFSLTNDLNIFRQDLNTPIAISVLQQIAEGKNLNEVDFNCLTNDRNAVKFLINSLIQNKRQNPLAHFTSLGKSSLHFNATEFATLLKQIGIKRLINVVEDTVVKIKTDKDKYITSVFTKNNGEIPCDFVFDCSGFKRIIIGNFYKSKWNSYKEYLPVNKAISFQIPIPSDTDSIPPYTEAIAMKYGWMWKIPTQTRFGCGYVFDGNLISADKAKKEIDEYTGNDTEIIRTFNFEPGTYNETWIKNCVAIGLSSGFVEPLEATSMLNIVYALRTFVSYINGATNKNEYHIKIFNNLVNMQNTNIVKFLQFHYLTNKKNTVFWKDFIKNNKICEYNQFLLDSGRDPSLLSDLMITDHVFNLNSWLSVGAGNFFFSADKVNEVLASLKAGIRKRDHENNITPFSLNMNLAAAGLLDHKFFLDYIKTESVKFPSALT